MFAVGLEAARREPSPYRSWRGESWSFGFPSVFGLRPSRFLAENSFTLAEEDTLEVHLEGLGVGRPLEGLFLRDLAGLDELEQRLVEILHAVVHARLDGCGEFLEPVSTRSSFISMVLTR